MEGQDRKQTIPFASQDLAKYLVKYGELSGQICKVLEANNIDGETFLNLKRIDLMDLFSCDFKSRKMVADCIEFMKLNGVEVDQGPNMEDKVLKDKSISASLPSISGSTDHDSDNTESDIIPSTQEVPVVPKRKRYIDLEETEVDIIPATQQLLPVNPKRKKSLDLKDTESDAGVKPPSQLKRSNSSEYECLPLTKVKGTNSTQATTSGSNLMGFQFPITNEIRKCIKGGMPLRDENRRQLIRECVTCLQAKVGEVITNPDFKEASKIICNQVPILKDALPPHWPGDMEFPYWSSVLYLLKKRYLNLRSRKTSTALTTSPTSSTDGDGLGYEVDQKQVEDLNKELLKALSPIKRKEKRKGSKDEVNWDDVKKLQTLTFATRCKCIQEMQGRDIVENVLEKFPFLDIEHCLWNELELHIGNECAKSTPITVEDFRKRWSKMALCFTDSEENIADEDICMAALEIIHTKFKVSEPLLTFIPEDGTVAGFLESVTTNEPLLVGYRLDDGDCNTAEFQLFLVIDKDIILECQFKTGPEPLITLLAAYFAFNLSYLKSQANIFRFLEEHVLGKVPKRKTYLYKTQENSLLLKLKDNNK